MIAMPDLVVVALTILATMRLTGFLVDDDLIYRPRNKLIVWLDSGDGPIYDWFLDLVTCYWCVSIWVGAGLATVVYYLHDSAPVIIVLMALAASQVAGMWGDVGRE